MSKRDWIKYAAPSGLITILLIGSIFWGYSVWRPYHEANKQSRAYAAKHDTSTEQKPIGVRCIFTGKSQSVCVIQLPKTEGADEHTKADLEAQQDTAEWAFLSVLIGFGTLIITAIGTFFVAQSLVFSAKATSAALEAAKYARDSLHSDRAWITTHGAPARLIKNGIEIRVHFKNSGRSPALFVKLAIDHKICAIAESVPIFDIEIKDDGTTIGCEQECFTPYASITGTDFEDFKNGIKIVYLYAVAEYMDIYEKTVRKTEICLRMQYPREAGVDELGATSIGPQNTTT